MSSSSRNPSSPPAYTPPRLYEYSFSGDRSPRVVLTSEAREGLRGKVWPVVRDFAHEAIERTKTDPHGEYSIDHERDSDIGQTERIVHRLSEAAEDFLGRHIAVKATGVNKYANDPQKYRMEFYHQFRLMHLLSSAQQEAYPNGIGGILTINRPYAYVSYRDPTQSPDLREYYFMDRVDGGMPLGDSYSDMEFTWVPRTLAAYVLDAHRAMGTPDPWIFTAGRVGMALAYSLQEQGITPQLMADTDGKNFLMTMGADGNKQFTAIDLQMNGYIPHIMPTTFIDR